jgi:hypothetical protein
MPGRKVPPHWNAGAQEDLEFRRKWTADTGSHGVHLDLGKASIYLYPSAP